VFTAEPPFTVKAIDYMHQTGPRKGVQHPAVCYSRLTLDVYQVCHCAGRCFNRSSAVAEMGDRWLQ